MKTLEKESDKITPKVMGKVVTQPSVPIVLGPAIISRNSTGITSRSGDIIIGRL